MKIQGQQIVLYFDHVGSGLVGLDGKDLSGFSIAGEDKRFVPAKAVIAGNTVEVSSEQVLSPVPVRLGWMPYSVPNLGNIDGLLASPFRTDK